MNHGYCLGAGERELLHDGELFAVDAKRVGAAAAADPVVADGVAGCDELAGVAGAALCGESL